MSKEEASQEQSSRSDLRSVKSCGNSEDHRSTSSFLHFCFFFLGVLYFHSFDCTDKRADGYMMLIRISN